MATTRQDYEDLRKDYKENLRLLKGMPAEGEEEKVPEARSKALAGFDVIFKNSFREPRDIIITEEILGHLRLAKKIMFTLTALKKASTSQEGVVLSFPEDALEPIFLHTATLAADLLKREMTPNPSENVLRLVNDFITTTQQATALIKAPDAQKAQALIQSAETLNNKVKGKLSLMEYFKYFIGALLILAGVVLSLLSVVLCVFTTPTGVGFIPGIPLGLLGATSIMGGYKMITGIRNDHDPIQQNLTQVAPSCAQAYRSLRGLGTTLFPDLNKKEPSILERVKEGCQSAYRSFKRLAISGSSD